MLYTDTPARIQNPGTWPLSTALGAQYTIGRDHVREPLTQLLNRTRDVSADIETYGLGLAARRLKSVTFSDDTHAIILDPRDPYQENLIQKTHEYASTIKYFNSPFDVPLLYINGLIRMEDVTKVLDPLLWTRIANPGERVRKNLTDACDRYMKTGPGGELEKAFKALNLSKIAGYEQFDLDRPIYVQGAAMDPLLTHRLAPIVRQAAYDKITKHPFGNKGVTGQDAWALVDREQLINQHIGLPRACKGFRVDLEYADAYQAENSAELETATRQLESAGVKTAQDLARVLDEAGAIPPNHPRTPKTQQLQMTADSMSKIAHPLAREFVRRGQIEKVGKDYIGKVITLALDGRVHALTSWLAAATGRASMTDPPLHQFNGPARGILLPDEGDRFCSLDLSQGEPVTVANACQDMQVLHGYEDGTSDLYTGLGVYAGRLPFGTTTADCEQDKVKKGIRGELKQALLAQLYGQGPALLTAKLGLDDGPWDYPSQWEVEVRGFDPNRKYPQYAAAADLKAAVFRAMPKTKEFVEVLKGLARRHRLMMTISGRVVDIPVGKFGVEAHKGVNYFAQGGQYDLIADALVEVIRAGLAPAIYLTMHDEFLTSVDAAPDIRRILETPSERLCFWAQRTPILRTDMALTGPNHDGERWSKS